MKKKIRNHVTYQKGKLLKAGPKYLIDHEEAANAHRPQPNDLPEDAEAPPQAPVPPQDVVVLVHGALDTNGFFLSHCLLRFPRFFVMIAQAFATANTRKRGGSKSGGKK